MSRTINVKHCHIFSTSMGEEGQGKVSSAHVSNFVSWISHRMVLRKCQTNSSRKSSSRLKKLPRHQCSKVRDIWIVEFYLLLKSVQHISDLFWCRTDRTEQANTVQRSNVHMCCKIWECSVNTAYVLLLLLLLLLLPDWWYSPISSSFISVPSGGLGRGSVRPIFFFWELLLPPFL